MKHWFTLILLALMVAGCTPPPRYILTSQEAVNEKKSATGTMPAERFLLDPGYYTKNPLPFLDVEPLQSTIRLLKGKKLNKAHLLLTDSITRKDDDATVFAYALVYFFEGKFDSCQQYITRLAPYSQNCFMRFLAADCSFELTGTSSGLYDASVDQYQEVLDCAPEDGLHKEIVKMRIKMLRYGY